MNGEHDELRQLLGAYVLGGLSTADRLAVDRHVSSCDECRDELAAFSVLPSLLRAAGPRIPSTDALPGGGEDGRFPATSGMGAGQETEGPSPTSLPLLIAKVRRERRRRRVRAGFGVAAAVAAAMTLGAVFARSSGPDAGTANTYLGLRPVAATSASGRVGLLPRHWGTELVLDLSSLPKGTTFQLWAVGPDGQRQQVGVWSSTPSGQAVLRAASSLPIAQIRAVEVAADGTTLLRAASG